MLPSPRRARVAIIIVATLVIQRLVTTMMSSWTPSVYESGFSPLSTPLRLLLPLDTVTPSASQRSPTVTPSASQRSPTVTPSASQRSPSATPSASQRSPTVAVSGLSHANRQRLSLLQRKCAANRSHYISTQSPLESLNEFLLDSKRGLVFCYIPKVGSSTMKRIFNVLAGNNAGVGILQISSERIHENRNTYAFGSFGKVLASATFLRKYLTVSNSTKFLFVRDPYERIFSGFVDRVYNFGTMPTLEALRRSLFPRGRSESVCQFAVHLKFQDIIEYITAGEVTQLDEHFRPYYVDCFPCQLNYDFIGKLETFKEDITTVLSSAKVKVTSVLGDVRDFDTRNDASLLIDVGMRTFTMMSRLSCMTKRQMLERTWQTLQVRGLLPVHVPFPVKDNGSDMSTPSDFKRVLLATFNQIQDRVSVKKQKKAAFNDAFYSLPRPLLKKLQALVQRDCDLFGYECSVDVRFNETERPKPLFHF